ncbi:paeninodin family lasso peptide [Halobacillus amylolyticus]|uniref:Paeninodin family lasso peptide n=1 Tax=Halobacillus amylolyticus TaxID=2932259 RepID=A0ABY4HFV9_9BACI|nr:paeninodin family lasso peptide [Halobacillus amylolyticus]UOR13778.1 paeninodin family lasso peptide [Halobacillus amylolyticus]
MRKEWKRPELEFLNINLTMAGPGLRIEDEYQNDPDPEDADHYS